MNLKLPKSAIVDFSKVYFSLFDPRTKGTSHMISTSLLTKHFVSGPGLRMPQDARISQVVVGQTEAAVVIRECAAEACRSCNTHHWFVNRSRFARFDRKVGAYSTMQFKTHVQVIRARGL